MPKSSKEVTAEFLQQAAEYQQRAMQASDPAVRAIFDDLAEQCRQLGVQAIRGPYGVARQAGRRRRKD